MTFTVGGDTCLYWQKPLSGAWLTNWGGAAVTTLHETEGWYAARVLVELYRYDRGLGQAKAQYLTAIDELFNWARHFVWTRNEFADVPSSPFAIGGTLSTAFLLDYYFTFKNDAQRSANATLALHLANNLIWRYLQVWAMDSDRSDGALDSAFLLEPNSGRDWAGLACANEVAWLLDSLTQVYVHTGDPRMRYYLRGIMQRWLALYQPYYRNSVADYGSGDFTEGLGLFDGSGPGRGYRYPYGSCETLPLIDPVGNSTMRVIAGEQACIAFDRFDQSTDVTDYRTAGNGACSFRIVSGLTRTFDVSFSYPFVNISGLTVTRVRGGATNVLTSQVTRPTQSPSSLYLSQLQNGDVITIGTVPAGTPTNVFDTSLVYNETNVPPATNGYFVTLPLNGNYPLPQDWTNLDSFAGIIPGLRWTYGVPYQQGLHAATNAVTVSAPGAKAVLVAYAPPESQPLTQSPTLTLDDSSLLPLERPAGERLARVADHLQSNGVARLCRAAQWTLAQAGESERHAGHGRNGLHGRPDRLATGADHADQCLRRLCASGAAKPGGAGAASELCHVAHRQDCAVAAEHRGRRRQLRRRHRTQPEMGCADRTAIGQHQSVQRRQVSAGLLPWQRELRQDRRHQLATARPPSPSTWPAAARW